MTKQIEVTVPLTAEVLSFEAGTPEEILASWNLCSSYIKTYEQVKEKLKATIQPFLDTRGQLEVNGYLFRESAIQRVNYDKAVLRQVIADEDQLDMFLEVSKKKVDEYIKEHLEELGDSSTVLRSSMIPVGRPYKTLRAEKLETFNG